MENIDELQWSSTNIKFLSEDVNRIFYEYKTKIEDIIHENYWLHVEEKILEMFRNIWLEISSRNNELLKLLEKKYNLDFLWKLDFSWGFSVSNITIEWLDNKNISSFFSKDYVTKTDTWYNSRWYWYYFNFDWFDTDGWINYNLHPEMYFKNIENYFLDTKNALKEFEWKDINDLNDLEKNTFLVLLEHYKNVLYFYQNFIILMSDKNKLAKHVWNLASRNFDKYYVYNKLADTDKYIEQINLELENSVNIFSDILLWIENNSEIKFWKTLDTKVFDYSRKFFKESFDLQNNIVEDLENKESNGKKTDIKGTKKFIAKTNNKFIWNLLRIIREEDNPVKQIFASFNIARSIPDDIENIDINWMLYWWIEMPYFMKYVLTRFYTKNSSKLNINLISMSAYHNRNLKRVSNANEYPESDKSKSKKMQLVLDDNLFYGSTLQVWWNNLMDRWPVLSWVAELWLRRGKLWKLEEWKSFNFLLSKVHWISSVTPIEKNAKWWSYKNLVNKFIKRKLPKLVWKF